MTQENTDPENHSAPETAPEVSEPREATTTPAEITAEPTMGEAFALAPATQLPTPPVAEPEAPAAEAPPAPPASEKVPEPTVGEAFAIAPASQLVAPPIASPAARPTPVVE